MDEPGLVKSLCIVNSAPEVKVCSADDYWQGQALTPARVLSLATIGKALGDRPFPKPHHQADLRRKMAERWAKNDKRAYLASFDAIVGWAYRNDFRGLPVQPWSSAPTTTTPRGAVEIRVKLLPDARLVVIEDSRHATPLDQPEVFNATLLDFLKTVETTTQDHRPMLKKSPSSPVPAGCSLLPT